MNKTNQFIRVPLGEFSKAVAREINIAPEQTYTTIGCRLYGQGVYQREIKMGAEIRAKKMFLVKEDDFIINRIWAQKGSAGIVPSNLAGSVVTQDFPVFELDRAKVVPMYVAWYVKTQDFQDECKRHSYGTSGRQRLSPKEISNITFPLCGVHEQQRILTQIEKIASKIDESRDLRAETQNEAAGLLSNVSGKIYDNLSKELGTVKLVDISTQITDGTHQTPTYVLDGVPFLSVKDITSGEISFSNVKYISEEEHRQLTRRCKPEKGDVLLTKVGTTGFAKAIDVEKEFSIFVSLCLIKLKKDIALPKYVEHMLNSSSMKRLSKEYTRGIGNKNLVLKFINNFPIPLPKLPVQALIVAYLDSLQEKIRMLEKLLAETEEELEELMPNFLDRAFKGNTLTHG